MGRSLTVTTADDVLLDTDLAVPEDVSASVVLCHPHPRFGGNRHAGVIDTLYRALPEHGIAALRFDFRGVGASTGTHDGGRAERLDVAAAAEALAAAAAGPQVLAGWSFGADVALAVDAPTAGGWFGVAPVLGVVEPSDMVAGRDPRPVRLLVPTHDQHTPPAAARHRTAGWIATEVHELSGTDHYLAGRHQEVTAALVAFISGLGTAEG